MIWSRLREYPGCGLHRTDHCGDLWRRPMPSILGRDNLVSSMVCRIRRYRDLASGFGVKNNAVVFMPFLLKLAFKNVKNEVGNEIYLVIQASPFFSAFKSIYIFTGLEEAVHDA
ncbi:Period circadian protein [Papilio machaon]|uniref:Period circadian protein n=1 Tax=Papilio machaon TaxID=76193 RepID=A0A0N1IQG6_PAPMA|nr:Period circadian protein [Papilio machaon]